MNTRVMVVDDSDLARSFIKDALATGGYDVVAEAGGGQQALELVDSVQPDLITIDYNMPGIDGEETLRLILKKKPKANIVMITSLAEPMMIEDLMKIGAKAVFCKPFNTDNFLRTIGSILSGHTAS
jgi:DNA-binding NarL/FixJ family response regulator